MTRRAFIAGLGSAAVAAAQNVPVLGYLFGASATLSPHLVAAFQQGLHEIGFVEGRNVAIEFRWAENRFDQLPALAADLVHRRVDVIAATGGPAALAAQAASATIPIVFR